MIIQETVVNRIVQEVEDETTVWNNRGNESNQPNGMDRSDEQHSSNSRTDSNKGSNLQLEEQDNEKEVDNTSFLMEKQQIQKMTKAIIHLW